MKKLIFLIALFGTYNFAFAQEFGKVLVTGTINFSSTTYSSDQTAGLEDKELKLSINPQAGFFISSTVALGLSATYTRENYHSSFTTNYPDGIQKTIPYESIGNNFAVGPFVRVYQSITPRFAFFGHGMGYYTFGKSEFEYEDDRFSTSPSKHKGGGISINPGLVFFPNNTIGIEATLGKIGYSKLESESEEQMSIKSSGFEASLGLNTFSLGISLYLGRIAKPTRF